MFFPRCYDLTNKTQMTLFTKDFNRTGALNILKKYAATFKRLHSKELSAIHRHFNKYDKQWIKRIKNIYKSSYGVIKEEALLINTFIIKRLFAYIKKEILNEAHNCKDLEDILLSISTFKFPYNDLAKQEISVSCLEY